MLQLKNSNAKQSNAASFKTWYNKWNNLYLSYIDNNLCFIKINFFFVVVLQKYDIHLFDEFVLRGNMAVLRCPIPSFVQDYVKVTSWERVDGFLITPGIISGNID